MPRFKFNPEITLGDIGKALTVLLFLCYTYAIHESEHKELQKNDKDQQELVKSVKTTQEMLVVTCAKFGVEIEHLKKQQ